MRLTMTVDAPSARLIALTGAMVAAGVDDIPRATAKTIHGRSRGARGALIAGEPSVALELLRELLEVLNDEQGVYADALVRRTDALIHAIEWKPRS